LTIDGDLTITGSGEQTIRVKDNGIFTLENGTIESLSIDWHSAIYIEDGGTVNINGGAVLDLYNKFSEGAIYANGGIVTVNVSGGVITGYSHGIKLFHYDSTDSRSTVTVSGGTITTTAPETAAQTYGVRVEKGNVKIDGDAEINALFPVAVDVGSMDISDGTINGNLSLDTCPTAISGGTVNGYIDISDTNTVTITGGTFNNIILNNCGTVEISGGEFTASGTQALYLSSPGDVTISGGKFSGSTGIEIFDVDAGKSVLICGDADISGENRGVFCSNGNVVISGEEVEISGVYGLYVSDGCTVTVSGGTITGNSYGSIYINGGALTLTGGTIMNTTNQSGYYGIYIQEGPTNNEITSTEDLVISAHSPLFYKTEKCFDSLPGPQKLAVGETKDVRVMGYDISVFEYTVDTENTSAELNARKEDSTTFPIAPTAAGDYVLVLSGRKSGEYAFLKLTIPVEVVYSLTYDANGGTGTAPAKEYLDAAETFTTAPWNTFAPPPGKQFKEWNTAADGTGTAYSANTTVAMPANNLTLYAIWEDIPDTTYIANIDPASKTFTAAVVNYSQQAAQEFTITNTGTGTITGLSAVLLSGENFEISAALSASSLNAGGTATVSVRPKTGLAAGTYTDTLDITGDNGISLTAGLSFTVNPATYGIALDRGGIYTFAGKTAGYDSVTPLTVTITNVGNQATGDLTCALSGTNPDSYTLSKTTVDSIAVGGSDTFTVVPKTGLAAGTYTATVTVSGDGKITAQTFTVDFTVAAAPVTYTVTFNSNGSVYATKTVNVGESIGNAAWPANPARNNYTFGGWFTGENGTGTQFTSATPVNAAMTVYAKWTYSGGSGGSGGRTTQSTPTTPAFNAVIQAGSGPAATLPVTVDTKSGTAHIDIGSHKLTSERTVITIPSIPDVDTYSVGIPFQNLANAGLEGLTVETAQGTITVPSNMLTGTSGINESQAEISIGKGDKDNLPDDIKSAIGDKPLIQLALYIDGRQTVWSNPNAPVTVSIPYTPTEEELANPESIVVWYIYGTGKAVSVPNGRYDPATGNVTFTTTHFSHYAVAYSPLSFSDVAADAWYEKAVSFIAAREITTGTGRGNFSPEAKLTRGQFIVMLMKAYGIDPDANPKDNFADAGSTYYTGYLAAAKRLGISAGVGSNLFAPGKEITRQEMFTLLYNALKVIGQLPEGSYGKTLSDFTDSDTIAPWAKDAMMLLVKAGIVGGSNEKLTPRGTTTRAEMAQVLYNLLGK